MNLTIALDGSRRRDFRLSAGDDITLTVTVYAQDADIAPVSVTDFLVSTSPDGAITVPVGTAFTVSSDAPGRYWYTLRGDIAGATTTMCWGVIELWGLDENMSGTRTLIPAPPAPAPSPSPPSPPEVEMSDYYDISTHTGVVTGALANSAARQANGVALQAALDYCITAGKRAWSPAARYEYECTSTSPGTGYNTGLHFKNAHPGFLGAGGHTVTGTRFIQYATNHPAITIGDVSDDFNQLTGNATFKGFAAGYGVSQTGQTQATAILIGRLCYSILDDFLTSEYISGGVFHPYIALQIGKTTAQTFWSNTIPMCRISGGQAHYFRMDASGTGNAWGSAYFGGGNTGPGNRQVLSGYAVYLALPGSEFGTIEQLNIEWCESFGALFVDGCSGMDIGVLHLEGNKLTGFAPQQINVNSPGRLNIGILKLQNIWIDSANYSGTAHILHCYSDPNVTINHVMMIWDGASEQVAVSAFQFYQDDTTLVGRRPHVEVGNIQLIGHSATFNLDNVLTAANSGNVTRLRKYRYDPSLPRTEGARVLLPSGAGPDTARGVHAHAQYVLDTTIAADRKLLLSTTLTSSGAGSTTARQPGDTLNFYRTGNATGAFNWVIRDSGDTTTLATVATANSQATLTWTGSAWA